ncbi:hypothetical protein TrVE_jg4609 [Triparma verrucosa]|uniref:Uncharacterized protein n=1 Tax=Triparma verrucosa TaxID=1606542 RepID=A0A9W7BV17_9STRA|nr:hypothetical protein TrVE_jg4609 [Triparma verrucosa]
MSSSSSSLKISGANTFVTPWGCILAFSAGGFIAVGHSLLSDVPSSKIIKKSIGGACAGLGVYVIVPTWCRQMWLQKF